MASLTNDEIEEIKELLEQNKSYREIAKIVLGRESRKSTIGDFVKRSEISGFGLGDNEEDSKDQEYKDALDREYKKAKILFIDIETAPLQGALWSLWQDGIGLNQMQSDWYILSFTAKWAHSDEIIYMDKRDSWQDEDDHDMLTRIWELLDEADYVAGHNTKRFDVKKIFARFIINGFSRPSTFRHIDTLQIAKSIFGFTSNKLEYLTEKMCTEFKKSSHKKFPGYKLWSECLKGNMEAWEEMEEYNNFDVLSNQELYEVFMPWDTKLPNFDVHSDEEYDMDEWEEDGFHYSNLGKYQRYRHKYTGQQRRGRTNLLSKEKRATLLANIVS